MIRFDPKAMSAPLADLAATLKASSEAPAILARVERGDRSASHADGVSDSATGAEARADQTFDIGSQTKMMTAVVVLQLVEEGLIALDAPAARWLPADVVAGLANADIATVRELLGMTSGIPNYTEAVNSDGLPLFIEALLENPGQVFGPADALEIARAMPATATPGERFTYTNTAYTLLGTLIETVTGAALADELQRRVFDPAGMTATTARPFGSDDPRLSSYAIDPTGAAIDVTDAPFVLGGEGGVISTTSDMIGFLRALLVDRSLLGEEALAQMMSFQPIDSLPGEAAGFGLGLASIRLDDGRDLVGFTGETLGANSSSYLDLASGTFVSVAGTRPDVDSQGGSLAMIDAVRRSLAWAPVADDAGPIRIATGAAADLRLVQTPDGLELSLGDATLTLDRDRRDLTADAFDFADGSVLALGDNAADRISIARDYHGARDADNQIRGFGGDDRLTGGTGADVIFGGSGDDILRGNAGDDRLRGGAGDDVLRGGDAGDLLIGGAGDDRLHGGPGRDILYGGTEEDTFVFHFSGGVTSGTDVIRDFEPDRDTIDLSALRLGSRGDDDGDGRGGADGDGGGGLVWLGADEFGSIAGEARYGEAGGFGIVQVDLDGDGAADFAVRLAGRPDVAADDFVF